MNSSHFGHENNLSPQSSPSLPSAHLLGLINDDIQYTLRVLIDTFVKMSICILGVGANITNIIVFLQTGLKDSVTISFLGLALADLGFVSFTFSYQLFEILDITTALKPEVDYLSLAYDLTVYAFYFLDISVLIIVFISLQKCACVAIPFLFKNIFTPRLASGVLFITYFIMLIDYMPLFIIDRLVPPFDSQNNRTRFKPKTSDLEIMLLSMFTIFNRIVIPVSAVILVTASISVMTAKLLAASKLRQAMVKKKMDPATDRHKVFRNNQLSSKELKVVQAVFVISVIYVSCNVPDLVSFLVCAIIPDFSYDGSYVYSFKLTRAIQNVLAVTNATVSILVYFRYNSKYRRQLLSDLGCNSR